MNFSQKQINILCYVALLSMFVITVSFSYSILEMPREFRSGVYNQIEKHYGEESENINKFKSEYYQYITNNDVNKLRDYETLKSMIYGVYDMRNDK